MATAAHAFAGPFARDFGSRMAMVRDWGRIRWRMDGGKRRPYLDFRPHGRVYSTRAGRPLATEGQADELLLDIRAHFASGGLTREEALAAYVRTIAPTRSTSSKPTPM